MATTSSSRQSPLAAGVRVLIYNSLGTVRYLGPIQFADGDWVGVELDYPVGDNDGHVEDVRYFTCPWNHGVFMRPGQVRVIDDPVDDQHDQAAFPSGLLLQAAKTDPADDGDQITGSESAIGADLDGPGRIWVCGDNQYGQLGLGHQRPACLFPTLVTVVNHYDDDVPALILNVVLAGDCSMALVCRDERVVRVMSAGAQVQIAVASGDRFAFGPVDVGDDLFHVTGVAANGPLSAVCSQDGSVLVWGRPWSGQLSGLGPIRDLQCSHDYVVVVGVDGTVIVIGRGLRPVPVRFPDSVKIVQISCRASSYMALSDAGSVWTWDDRSVGDEIVADRVEIDAVIARIACGNEHHLALSNEGDVYSWGAGRFGCLGTGSYCDEPDPVLISSLTRPVVDIAAGARHSVCLTDDGRVCTWGDGSHGQLGHGDTSSFPFPRPVLSLEKRGVRQIAAGPNQTLAATDAFVGPDRLSHGLDQLLGRGAASSSYRGRFRQDVPEVQDAAVDDTGGDRVVRQLVYRLNSRPYCLEVIQCDKVQLLHRSIQFDVEHDVLYRGALNNYMRNCYERHRDKNPLLFKNLSVSRPAGDETSKVRCTLLVICNDDPLHDDAAEQIPDWISSFIDAFYPIDVGPRFVLLCPTHSPSNP